MAGRSRTPEDRAQIESILRRAPVPEIAPVDSDLEDLAQDVIAKWRAANDLELMSPVKLRGLKALIVEAMRKVRNL